MLRSLVCAEELSRAQRQSMICELLFPSSILAVKLNRKTLVIVLEAEIYIYDIRVTQTASPGASAPPSPEIPLPRPYQPTAPPNELSDQRSLQSWQELFKMRRDWALKTADDCRLMAQAAQDRYGEMDVMMRCLDAAVANLEEGEVDQGDMDYEGIY